MITVRNTLNNKNTPGIPTVSGRFYSCPFVESLTTFAMSASILYAIPILLTSAETGQTNNIEVTVQSAGNNLRMGIYADSDGVPSSLILDAGTVSLTGTGNKPISISQNLSAGWYWLACVTNGTPTVRALSQSNALPVLGFTSATDTTTHVGWSVAFTYAALPNPFTGGGALMTTAAPRLMLGV